MSELYDRDYQILLRRLTQTETETEFFIPVPQTAIEIKPPIAMKFTVEKTLEKTPNTLDLTIFNLAPRTRAELENTGIIIRFAAGYADGGPRRMFVGDVKFATSSKKGTEWITEIQVRDGGRAYGLGRADKSFKSGARVIDVLRFVAGKMQLVLPRELEASDELQRQFQTGYAMSAPAQREMSRLLAPFGYSWSIQNGKLVVLRDEETSTEQMREISVATGMLDSPVFSKPELKDRSPKRTVNVKIYPELEPGGRVNIVSRDIEGLHKIVKLRHTGDTESDEWRTECEVEVIGQGPRRIKKRKR